MTFNEKIDKYMKMNNIPNLKQFALQADIPYTTLRDFYEKQSADNSRLSTIRKLSKYMKCSMDYLAYDDILDPSEIKIDGIDIDMEDTQNSDAERICRFDADFSTRKDYENFVKKLDNMNIKYNIKTVVHNKLDNGIQFDNAEVIDINSAIIKIPVFGTIKAGIPIESQNDIIEYVDIPKEWAKGGKKFYGLKISGDSMFPKYNENDIVIFEQTNDIELYNGKDCAVMINGTESTFKKVLINEQGIVLQPYNTAYDIMMFSKEQVEQLPIKIVGIAVEKRTRL